NASSTGQRWNAGAAFTSSGGFAVCWSEFQNEHSDIAFQLFNSGGTAQLTELVLNDDYRGAPKTEPAILATSDWFNLIAFTSKAADQGNIMASCISNAGVMQISNTIVNQDVSAALQSEPSLGSSSTQGIIVWNDSRDVLGVPGQRIYGRYCSLFGLFTTNEFMICDSAQVGIKASPKVAMIPSGKGLVAWIDLRASSPQVWGRWLTAGGALDGVEVQISQAGTDSSCSDLSAGVDLTGRFYVTWVDRRTTPIVRGHWYNADGTDGGYISYTPAGALIDELASAINDSGEVTVAYTGNSSGQKLYIAAVDRASAQILAPTQINDDNTANPSEPDISFSESTNQYGIAWVDRRSGVRNIECQILDANRLAVGINQAVSSANLEYMISPSVTLNDGRAWFTWADPRQYGQNIWATEIIYEPTGIDDNRPGVIPSSFSLEQNYPNPFNPTTEIRFLLVTHGHATLEIFNIAGERVVTLADGVFSVGEHRISWDGSSQEGHAVASGIYFYRLTTANGSFTRKMALVK
ncbi:MAG: T9SS type A sorting domain-containing protein, partial [Candidatus Zixiibacteriota bacterium]